MKNLILSLIAASLSGCVSNLPKDLYVKGGEITINAYGIQSTVKGDVLATGKAAIEAARDVEQATTIPQTAAEKLAAKAPKKTP